MSRQEDLRELRKGIFNDERPESAEERAASRAIISVESLYGFEGYRPRRPTWMTPGLHLALAALLEVDLDVPIDRGPPREESSQGNHLIPDQVTGMEMLQNLETACRRHQGPVVQSDDAIALELEIHPSRELLGKSLPC